MLKSCYISDGLIHSSSDVPPCIPNCRLLLHWCPQGCRSPIHNKRAARKEIMDQFLHGGSCGQLGQLVCEHQNLIGKHWWNVFWSLITVVTWQNQILVWGDGLPDEVLGICLCKGEDTKTQTSPSLLERYMSSAVSSPLRTRGGFPPA